MQRNQRHIVGEMLGHKKEVKVAYEPWGNEMSSAWYQSDPLKWESKIILEDDQWYILLIDKIFMNILNIYVPAGNS